MTLAELGLAALKHAIAFRGAERFQTAERIILCAVKESLDEQKAAGRIVSYMPEESR